MANTSFNATQITPPRVPIIDDRTGLVSREWYRYFYSLYAFTGNGTGILPIPSGGTGLGTIPTDGQLLIGDTASSSYKLHVIDTGAGIAITNGSGTILITNTGVLSNIAGSGIGVSSATGNVTVSNTGVLSAIAGSGISVSSATGNVTLANTGVLSFSGGSTGLLPSSATTGAVSLSGTLGVGYGGTGQTTYTNGQLLIGNTTGNTLTKATLTAGSGVSISNGAGSITISATGSGGTVTAVTGTAPVVSSGGTTPAISMAAATASVNGYLTSTDWTTFNNKGSGSVTSVGGTGTVNGITLTGTVTTTGNLTLGGTLSGVSLTTQVSGVLPVANGGTNASTASITSFNNITGYSASGATGTTSTNLVFSTSPSITTPTLVGDATLSTGNLVVSNGKGIDFSATPGTGTSELLADYEEGTWTPAEANITLDTAVGHYTKVGNMVTAWACMVWPLTADANNVVINGLPFTTANSEDVRSAFISYCDSASLLAGTGSVLPLKNSTQSTVYKSDGNRVTNLGMSQSNLRATWFYFT